MSETEQISFLREAIKRGGGLQGCAIKEKRTFFILFVVLIAIKLEGGGVKALMTLRLPLLYGLSSKSRIEHTWRFQCKKKEEEKWKTLF